MVQPMVAPEESIRLFFAAALGNALSSMGITRPVDQKRWLQSELNITIEQARKYLKGLDVPREAKARVLSAKLGRSVQLFPDWTVPTQPPAEPNLQSDDFDLAQATPRTASRIRDLRTKIRSRQPLTADEASELDALLAKVEALRDAAR